MKINEVEKITGITSANIRYYERKNLLTPLRADENNYRLYTTDDVERLKQIKILRMMGIPIAEVKDLLDEKTDLKSVMSQRVEQLSEEEKNIVTVKNLCQTVLAYDMDIHMLNEQLLLENADLWKKKLDNINMEEKVHHLCRKTNIILCITTIILSFFPAVPFDNRILNIFQLLTHEDFVFNLWTILPIAAYLVAPAIFIYLLYGLLRYKQSLDLIMLPIFASNFSLVAQLVIVFSLTIILPDKQFTSSMYLSSLCLLIAFFRSFAGSLITVVHTSGEDIFMKILEKRAR